MTSRWDVERAVRVSDLPMTGKLVMYALATYTDHQTAVIPEQYGPSLTTLETATGLSRSGLAKALRLLEELKWVERERPSIRQARSKGARTQYRLRVPPEWSRDGHVTSEAVGQPGGSAPSGLGSAPGALGGSAPGGLPSDVPQFGSAPRALASAPGALDKPDSSPPGALDKPGKPGQVGFEVVHQVHQGSAPRALSPYSSNKELKLASLAARKSARGRQQAINIITNTTGATPDEATAVIDLIEAERQPQKIGGFVTRLAQDGDLPEWLHRVRTGQTSSRPSVTDQRVAAGLALAAELDAALLTPPDGRPDNLAQLRALLAAPSNPEADKQLATMRDRNTLTDDEYRRLSHDEIERWQRRAAYAFVRDQGRQPRIHPDDREP